jgi:hypothetical protein
VRYPLVELAVAVIFVGLAYFDVYLPAMETSEKAEIARDSRLAVNAIALAAHAWLACSLLAAALIRWDGMRVPWKLVVAATVMAGSVSPFVPSTQRWLLLGMSVVLIVVALAPPMKKPPASAGGFS